MVIPNLKPNESNMKKLIITAACTVLFLGCVATNCFAAAANVLMIYPSDQVEDNEYTITKTALESAGFNVVTANTSGRSATGMHGGTFLPDMNVSDVNAENYDMLVTIGGNGIFGDLENTDYIALVADFASAEKLTTGICGSTAIMAKSGIFEGIRATTFPYDPLIDILKANGADYVNESVVVSGNVITGNGPDAAAEFAVAIVKAAQLL